ncbi:YkgJ family cysteine cluster protein [Pseudochryseolinea flava]|uniref:YkgJ family cysteine cluster protein n=1 Tax=Pseudochryseolinea flava TaxID=2059302 RepID=A0A364Y672_9BACT|nr:YkgJ family cysteine cluster protein [Pseudochryseolinea flava]RAW01735.1 YkgJ family cysteine cluster protein [Pseudochryseolinea flava]
MTIEDKVYAVEQVMEKLDREIASFQQWSTLHCKNGCGKCCFKPDIEASALEFLPFAHHLFREGKADAWYENLRESTSPLCLILDPTINGVGLCSEYKHRGLICRLFGYSARTNKYGSRELVTCQVIKTEQQAAFEVAVEKIASQKGEVPIMSEYYMQLHAIDPDMAREFFPINKAIKRAIEVILHYYAYR